jgi:hypothetical protein
MKKRIKTNMKDITLLIRNWKYHTITKAMICVTTTVVKLPGKISQRKSIWR